MKKCKTCDSPLLEHARYCHECGKAVVGTGVVCLRCNAPNSKQSKFCYSCGYPVNLQYRPALGVSPRFKIDFNDIATLPSQLREAFLLYMGYLLEIEGRVVEEEQYLQAFDRSGFRQKVFEEEAIPLTIAIEALFEQGADAAFVEIEKRVEGRFLDWSEVFWIRYLAQKLPYPLSDNILRYQGKTIDSTILSGLVFDYLQPQDEQLTYYRNAVEIPIKTLNTARKSFYKHDADEYPYLFIDSSLLGKGKEGLILSSKAIYWKAPFHPAAAIPYTRLNTLRLQKNHLEINGLYFNLAEPFNYKMLKLLLRLRFWYSLGL